VVGIALILAFSVAPMRPAFAVSVTVPITVTVAETGPLPFTWTIGGSCAPVPGSGSTGGVVSVTMSANCPYTIDVSADGPTERDRLMNGASYVTSLPELSCGGGGCAAVTPTAHVQELLTVSGSCNGAVVSVVSPTGNRWYDYGTSLIVTCNGIWGRALGTGTRAVSWNWDGGASTLVATTSTFTSSLETMGAGHTLNVNTVTQYQLTLDPKATGALLSVTNPAITSDKYWYDVGTVVSYKGNGVLGRTSGVGNRSASWYLDSGAPTSLTTAGNFTLPATMNSAHTIHVTLVTQYRVSLNSGVSGMLSSITAPTITNDNYWYDSGTHVSLTLKGIDLRASGSGVRLKSYSLNTGPTVSTASTSGITILSSFPINQTESVAGTIVNQNQLLLDSRAAAALSGVTSPPIQADNYWYDSGTQVTYSGSGVFGRTSGTGSRITGWWWDSSTVNPVSTSGMFSATIIMNAPHSLFTTAVTQYQLALVGTYGVSLATPPMIVGDNYWYDSGTAVSLSLDGIFGRASGTGERMNSYSVNSGPGIGTATAGSVAVLHALTLTSPWTITVNVVAQYELTMDPVTLQSLSSVTAPTLTGDNYWYDSGSHVLVVAQGTWGRNSTSGYRLGQFSINGAQPLTVASSGSITLLDTSSISSPQSIVSTKVVQYLLAVKGGSGATYSVNPPIGGDTGWYDSGTTLRVSVNGTYDSAGGTRQRIASWSVDGGQSIITGMAPIVSTSAITMYAPHALNFVSVTQYSVMIVVKDSGGDTILAPDSLQLSVNGGSQRLIGNHVWVDGASLLSIFGITWHGADVAPLSPTQYTVTSPQTVTVNARVFDATIVIKDSLGFAIGGADAAITLANGTVVHATSGGDGTILLRMIPVGSYHGTVSNLGLSASVSGDASAQKTTDVSLFLSFPVVFAIVGVIVLVVVAIILIRRRR
jgi:hypothetical protein